MLLLSAIAAVLAALMLTLFAASETKSGNTRRLLTVARSIPFRDADRQREALVESVQRGDAKASSKAPWAENRRRYMHADYAWLIANARSDPQAGSYYFAGRAISQCADIKSRGSLIAQHARLVKEGGPNADKRIRALEKLYAPCHNTPDAETLGVQFHQLAQEAARAGDVVHAAFEVAAQVMSGKMPQEERNRTARDLLALNDPVVTGAIRGALTEPGATLDGKAIPSADLVAYRFAWTLTMCSYYDECLGPDSRDSQRRCLVHSECDYHPTWALVEQIGGSEVLKIADYYRAIQARLIRGEFSAFGPR